MGETMPDKDADRRARPLHGRTALVTGAAGGIGRASALLFAQAGANVIAIDRDIRVQATVAAIQDLGGQDLGRRAIARCGDTGTETFVSDIVDMALDEFGALDVFFANAGIAGGIAPLAEISVEEWTEVLRVNLIGAFLAVKHAARAMIPAERGSIICTASVAGLRSGAGGLPYSASKAGVINLVQTAANQLAGTNIRVNALCPGLIETGMTKPIFDHARARGTEGKIGQLNPLRRAGAPEEVARVALFLASDASSYVNGQAISVDGGLSSSHPVSGGRY